METAAKKNAYRLGFISTAYLFLTITAFSLFAPRALEGVCFSCSFLLFCSKEGLENIFFLSRVIGGLSVFFGCHFPNSKCFRSHDRTDEKKLQTSFVIFVSFTKKKVTVASEGR